MEDFQNFVDQFIEQYTPEFIEDDVVSFYNDAFMMIQHYKNNSSEDNKVSESYNNFIQHIIKNKGALSEYSPFDFTKISTYKELLSNKEVETLAPIYTPYSFNEIEEMIDQIFEELKTVKEFQTELKEEISFILEEYTYHVEHFEENMSYNFYTYTELDEIKENEYEDFRIEKRKFIQSCSDRMQTKRR